MKKIKTIILYTVIACCFFCILMFAGRKWFGWFDEVSENDELIAGTLEGYGADIIVYGDLEPSKKSIIKYREISSITEEELNGNSSEGYHLLVISDINGKTELTNGELQLILRYCTENHYDMIYFGNAHIDRFQDSGFFAYDLSSEWAFSYQAFKYRENMPYEYVDGEWKEKGVDNSYVANPYLTLLGYYEENNVAARKDSIEVWRLIATVALDSLTTGG